MVPAPKSGQDQLLPASRVAVQRGYEEIGEAPVNFVFTIECDLRVNQLLRVANEISRRLGYGSRSSRSLIAGHWRSSDVA